MKIHETMNFNGERVYLDYEDLDNFDNLPYKMCKQVYGACFLSGKLLVVYSGVEKTWCLPGGTPKSGESYEETLTREVKEEANMKVESFMPIGAQLTHIPGDAPEYQLRFACRIQPLGKFILDPAGSIEKISLINPRLYKEYFDWGRIGERIISRSVELVGV